MPDDVEHYVFILRDIVSFVCAFLCLHCDLFKKENFQDPVSNSGC